MKKIIALLSVITLIAVVVIPCCVNAKEICPVCNAGGLISIKYSDWKEVRGGATLHVNPKTGDAHWDGPSWKERTVTVKCTKGVHKQTEKKDRTVTHNINVVLWGYTR